MFRKQKKYILNDLQKKMVFITGPRQVGKTWLAKNIAQSYNKTVYLNYDRLEDKNIIKNEAWIDDNELLIFDELHKMPGWKNYIKGIFDTKPNYQKIIVTGSARMEFLRQTGDSLAGRYFRHRLLPFSLAEISDIYPATIERFLERGGFPEPFLADNIVDSDRWRMQYIDGLIRTDILDFEKIHDFKAIQLVLELLRMRVGAPVSYNSIAEDVGISPNTVKKYIQIFESLYIIFRVTPYSKNIARSLIKEPKIYFFDTGMVKGDKGIKFENFVAVSLLKHVYAINDYEGKYAELKYFRTKDGDEVDFCIIIDNNPITMIEVKFADKTLSKTLIKFHKKYNIPGIQLVYHLRQERDEKGIQIYKAFNFLKNLKL